MGHVNTNHRRSIAGVYPPKRKHEHQTGVDENDGNAKRPHQPKPEGPWKFCTEERVCMADDNQENSHSPQKI